MPDGQNLFSGLLDFSFRQILVRQLVKLLYVLALLGGGIAVVALVVTGYQQSPAQAVIALAAGLVGYFVAVVVVRLQLELALQILRIAENLEKATRGAGST